MITMFVGPKVIKTMTVGMASVFILFLGSMEALDDFPISSLLNDYCLQVF